MHIERNESRNIYFVEREKRLFKRERGSTSKTELFLLSQSILYQSIAVSVRSNQSTISHILASFWELIWFEIFLYVAHLYKYLLSALKTSRTNNTPFFDFSECSKTIDEKRVIQESIYTRVIIVGSSYRHTILL